jgi:tetratricopeptide (TPR) repeat protein
MFIGYPEMAQDCYENAIKLYGLNLRYYLNLAECYKRMGLSNFKIKELGNSNNIYDRIKLGLLYIQTDSVRRGINILDEICMEEPDLLITPALKQYIAQVVKEKL